MSDTPSLTMTFKVTMVEHTPATPEEIKSYLKRMMRQHGGTNYLFHVRSAGLISAEEYDRLLREARIKRRLNSSNERRRQRQRRDRKMAVPVRKLVYHPFHGVFLGVRDGKRRWSKDAGVTAKETAPTFDDRQGLEEYLMETTGSKEFPAGADLREVWPRGSRQQALPEDAANAGLPRWGE
jgi:hypothetical protein